VNADDFGHSKGVNLGIIESYRNGVVRSTTMMAGMPGFGHAARVSRRNPGLGVGVHLTLTAGKAVGGAYRTLTDADGNFLKLTETERRARAGELDLAEVESEYEAQIRKVYKADIIPDHFDSHHHTHKLPGVSGVFLKLAKKYGVKVRMYDRSLLTGEYAGIVTTDAFDDTFYGGGATAERLREIISPRRGASLEIMCHPAYCDLFLFKNSSYNTRRFFEMDVLTGKEIKDFIKANGHELCSFAEL
jgi:predicted glycoside hydrolase/deacetylase ChbG (UPF0249 family)